MKHFEKYNTLSCNRRGFMIGLSTVSQVARVVHYFANDRNNTGQADVKFLDFSKAVDDACYSKLIDKQPKLFRDDQITNRLRNYFKNRTQYADYNGEMSRRVDMCFKLP